jgi:hypothetical protein
LTACSSCVMWDYQVGTSQLRINDALHCHNVYFSCLHFNIMAVKLKLLMYGSLAKNMNAYSQHKKGQKPCTVTQNNPLSLLIVLTLC